LFFASTDGLRLPRIQTYIAKITLLFGFFHSPFFAKRFLDFFFLKQ